MEERKLEAIEVIKYSPKRKQGICIDCGKPISKKKNKRCVKCNAINKRKDKNVDRKEYCRNWSLKKKYGLEPGEFEVYWIAYKGKCFICERKLEMPEHKRGQKLNSVVVDHNHLNGTVRGLLCTACNTALGFFNDDISIMKKAIIYLGG